MSKYHEESRHKIRHVIIVNLRNVMKIYTSLRLLFSTLQMLTNIENRLEELFEMIEMMPQDKVEAAEKVK